MKGIRKSGFERMCQTLAAVNCLRSGQKYKDIAKSAGKSPNAVRKWVNKAGFKNRGGQLRHVSESIVDILLESPGPDLEKLKKHRQSLTPEEKAQIPTDLPSGDGATVLKAVVVGKTWYACYTHRACQVRSTMDQLVKVYPSIAATA